MPWQPLWSPQSEPSECLVGVYTIWTENFGRTCWPNILAKIVIASRAGICTMPLRQVFFHVLHLGCSRSIHPRSNRLYGCWVDHKRYAATTTERQKNTWPRLIKKPKQEVIEIQTRLGRMVISPWERCATLSELTLTSCWRLRNTKNETGSCRRSSGLQQQLHSYFCLCYVFFVLQYVLKPFDVCFI